MSKAYGHINILEPINYNHLYVCLICEGENEKLLLLLVLKRSVCLPQASFKHYIWDGLLKRYNTSPSITKGYLECTAN